MLDVVDEGPGSIGSVPHERAPRGRFGVNPDSFHMDAVAAQTIEIDPPKVIFPHASNDGGRLTKLSGLIDENRRGAGREGANQLDRLQESVALVGRHDLDEDLADGEDRFHRSGRAIRPNGTDAPTMRFFSPGFRFSYLATIASLCSQCSFSTT